MSFWRDIRLGKTLTDTTCPEALARPCLGSNGHAVGRSGSTARIWKGSPDGSWHILTEQCVGQWAGAIDYLDRAIWQELGVGVVRELGAGYERLPQYPYQSAGIQDVQPDNTVVMEDGQPHTFRRKDGSILVVPMGCVRAGRCAGYANEAPDGIICYDTGTDILYRVWTGDPQSLPLRLDDDGQTVSVSGLSGGFVPFSQWTIEAPAPPVLPTIPPFTEKKILASYDTGRALGDNGVVIPHMMVLSRNSDDEDFPYFDTEEDEPVVLHPCVVYSDIKSTMPALLQMKAGDALAINVYPTAGQPLSELATAVQVELRTCRAHGFSLILVGCAWNRLGTISDQLVLDGMKLVRDLAEEPGVIGVEWFGLNRGTSLGYFKPLYQQCVDLFVSPGWPDWPAVVPPPPQDAAALLLLKGLS